MKKIYFLPVFISVLAVFFVAFFARPVSALSEGQSTVIVQNCATIKQSLRALQRTDARSRSYLGSAYETIISNFITPLNLRLVSNGQPNTNLTNLHSQILDTRKSFISEYTTYSQALEDLISTDCYTHPEDFYNKLYDTRKKRAEVSTITTNLRNLLSEYLTAVRRLKTTMGAKDGGE